MSQIQEVSDTINDAERQSDTRRRNAVCKHCLEEKELNFFHYYTKGQTVRPECNEIGDKFYNKTCKKCMYKTNRKFLCTMHKRGTDEYYCTETTKKEHKNVGNGTLRVYIDINKFIEEWNIDDDNNKIKNVKLCFQNDRDIKFNYISSVKQEYKTKEDKKNNKVLYDVIKLQLAKID